MARVSDGTNVPISPAPASSLNVGSPDGSLPDLEGTGFRASTMEEKINEIYLQLPFFIQNAARIENLRPDACSNSGCPVDQDYKY